MIILTLNQFVTQRKKNTFSDTTGYKSQEFHVFYPLFLTVSGDGVGDILSIFPCRTIRLL